MSRSRSLSDRVSEALAALLRSEGGSAPALGASSVLDEAISQISLSIQRFHFASHLIRFAKEGPRDRIAVLGRPIEFRISLEALFERMRAGHLVRFYLDGHEIGHTLSSAAGIARLVFTPERPGLSQLACAVTPRDGPPGSAPLLETACWLQVVADAPLAIMDAALLLPPMEAGAAQRPLQELSRRGWEVCYADLGEVDRSEELRVIIERLGLPRGALLPHPAMAVGHEDAFLTPRPVLAVHTLRRIRCRGAAAVLTVVDHPDAHRLAAAEGITAMSLAELAHALAHDGLNGPRARAAEFVRVRDEAEAAGAAARLRRSLDIMTGSPLVHGNRFHAEFDNGAARRRLFELVAGARRSLHLQAYMLKEGRFSDQLVVRLVERARAGVRVRITLDALYGGHAVLGSKNPVVSALGDEPGIEVVASDPISLGRAIDTLALKERDHRKLLIVDGVECIVSGRNLADEYYLGLDEVPITDTTPHEKIPWLDAHIEVRGPLVAQIQRIFLDNWRRNGGAPPTEEEEELPAAAAGTASGRVVFHDGLGDTNALAAYEAIVMSAERRLLIVNDFPVVEVLAEELVRAVARGVRVDILTGCALTRRGDGTFFSGGLHRRLFELMTKRRFESLLRAGVQVHELSVPEGPWIVVRGGAVRPYVHAKVMCADGLVVSIGSANLDATASYWEREVNVVVEDAAFAADVEARIDALLAGSVRIDVESAYWKSEEAERAIADKLWPDVVYS